MRKYGVNAIALLHSTLNFIRAIGSFHGSPFFMALYSSLILLILLSTLGTKSDAPLSSISNPGNIFFNVLNPDCRSTYTTLGWKPLALSILKCPCNGRPNWSTVSFSYCACIVSCRGSTTEIRNLRPLICTMSVYNVWVFSLIIAPGSMTAQAIAWWVILSLTYATGTP